MFSKLGKFSLAAYLFLLFSSFNVAKGSADSVLQVCNGKEGDCAASDDHDLERLIAEQARQLELLKQKQLKKSPQSVASMSTAGGSATNSLSSLRESLILKSEVETNYTLVESRVLNLKIRAYGGGRRQVMEMMTFIAAVDTDGYLHVYSGLKGEHLLSLHLEHSPGVTISAITYSGTDAQFPVVVTTGTDGSVHVVGIEIFRQGRLVAGSKKDPIVKLSPKPANSEPNATSSSNPRGEKSGKQKITWSMKAAVIRRLNLNTLKQATVPSSDSSSQEAPQEEIKYATSVMINYKGLGISNHMIFIGDNDGTLYQLKTDGTYLSSLSLAPGVPLASIAKIGQNVLVAAENTIQIVKMSKMQKQDYECIGMKEPLVQITVDVSNPFLVIARQSDGDLHIFHTKYRTESSKSGSESGLGKGIGNLFGGGRGSGPESCKLIKTIPHHRGAHESFEESQGGGSVQDSTGLQRHVSNLIGILSPDRAKNKALLEKAKAPTALDFYSDPLWHRRSSHLGGPMASAKGLLVTSIGCTVSAFNSTGGGSKGSRWRGSGQEFLPIAREHFPCLTLSGPRKTAPSSTSTPSVPSISENLSTQANPVTEAHGHGFAGVRVDTTPWVAPRPVQLSGPTTIPQDTYVLVAYNHGQRKAKGGGKSGQGKGSTLLLFEHINVAPEEASASSWMNWLKGPMLFGGVILAVLFRTNWGKKLRGKDKKSKQQRGGPGKDKYGSGKKGMIGGFYGDLIKGIDRDRDRDREEASEPDDVLKPGSAAIVDSTLSSSLITDDSLSLPDKIKMLTEKLDRLQSMADRMSPNVSPSSSQTHLPLDSISGTAATAQVDAKRVPEQFPQIDAEGSE